MVMVLTRELGKANLAYKGGYILNKRIPNCRFTKDVDLSIAQKELYLDVKRVMTEIANHFISKGIVTSYTIKEDVTETLNGGIQFYNSSNEKTIGVDVGLHPLSFGITSLTISIGDFNVFSIERSLSDKLFVVCSRKRFRRTKDLYDIYMLTTLFDITYKLLSECIEYRSVDWNLFPSSEEVLVQLEYAYNKLTIGKEGDTFVKEKPIFQIVMAQLVAFCDPFLTSRSLVTNWNHERSHWV
jgi:predicted nucleotidyltransferase component of viral defense system